ncbi:hypothetical protein F5Y15DRAFT_136494 [Xylariaceae sp. FL0016]|nr:hypothetical protein F5Y15DRAFT_136494 [Xylariaceae sp. FL0016]
MATGLRTPHDSNLGITAYMIRILDIRDQVKKYLKTCYINNCPPCEGDAKFWRLHQQLEDFGNLIPADLRNTERAIFVRVNADEQTSFVMMQTWWHCCYCELFAHFVYDPACCPGQLPRPHTDFVALCTSEMARFALLLNSFWRSVYKIAKGHFVTDWFIGPCILENTQALVRAAEFSPAVLPDRKVFEAALTLNMEILNQVACLSPYVASFKEESTKVIGRSSFSVILNLTNEELDALQTSKYQLNMEQILDTSRQKEFDRFPPQDAEAMKVSPTIVSTPSTISEHAAQAMITDASPVSWSQYTPSISSTQFDAQQYQGLYGEDITTAMGHFPLSFDQFLAPFTPGDFSYLAEPSNT